MSAGFVEGRNQCQWKRATSCAARRAGMPPEQVIVMLANLSGGVVMADVVEVGSWQRDVEQAENQQSDPQPTDSRRDPKATKPH